MEKENTKRTLTIKSYERSKEIDIDKDFKLVKKIVDKLKKTLKEDDKLIALSAPQVGYSYRIISLKFSDGEIKTFINPIIAKTKGIHLSRELEDDKEYIIPRNDEIIVIYQDPLGKGDSGESNRFGGYVSDIFQQYINLLDGVFVRDIGLELLDGWDDMTKKDQSAVLSLYINKLKTESELAKREIKEDEELNKMNKAIDFIGKVQRGEIEFTPIKKEELSKEFAKKLEEIKNEKEDIEKEKEIKKE